MTAIALFDMHLPLVEGGHRGPPLYTHRATGRLCATELTEGAERRPPSATRQSQCPSLTPASSRFTQCTALRRPIPDFSAQPDPTHGDHGREAGGDIIARIVRLCMADLLTRRSDAHDAAGGCN